MMIRFATRFTYKRFKTEIARFLCMIFQNVIFLAFFQNEADSYPASQNTRKKAVFEM
jgi:hypothetical protein